VPDRRHSAPAYELWRQRDRHDHGLAWPFAERETAAAEFVLLNQRRRIRRRPNCARHRIDEDWSDIGTWDGPRSTLTSFRMDALNGRSLYGCGNCNHRLA